MAGAVLCVAATANAVGVVGVAASAGTAVLAFLDEGWAVVAFVSHPCISASAVAECVGCSRNGEGASAAVARVGALLHAGGIPTVAQSASSAVGCGVELGGARVAAVAGVGVAAAAVAPGGGGAVHCSRVVGAVCWDSAAQRASWVAIERRGASGAVSGLVHPDWTIPARAPCPLVPAVALATSGLGSRDVHSAHVAVCLSAIGDHTVGERSDVARCTRLAVVRLIELYRAELALASLPLVATFTRAATTINWRDGVCVV